MIGGTMIKDNLPNLPSQLLRLALKDLERCEQSPDYEINMGEWYKKCGKTCTVCLGGSVLAQTCGYEVSDRLKWADLEDSLRQKIDVIDDLRSGYLGYIPEKLGLPLPAGFPECVFITHYEINPVQFKKDMEKLITLMEDNDL